LLYGQDASSGLIFQDCRQSIPELVFRTKGIGRLPQHLNVDREYFTNINKEFEESYFYPFAGNCAIER
jgi:hypothetical protein